MSNVPEHNGGTPHPAHEPAAEPPDSQSPAEPLVLDHDQPLSAVAGVLASSVTAELGRPLRQLRELLAIMLESIEHHISQSEGPDALPWQSIQGLRQGLADAYLLSRDITRLAGELGEVMGAGRLPTQPQPVDVNRQIEAALTLVRPRFRPGTELFVDLGSVPPIRAVAGEIALIVAKLLLCCADSASARPGSAVSVQTRYEREQGAEAVVIAISDNGAGVSGGADSARRALEPVMSRLGGTFDGISEPDTGSAFECIFPLSRS